MKARISGVRVRSGVRVYDESLTGFVTEDINWHKAAGIFCAYKQRGVCVCDGVYGEKGGVEGGRRVVHVGVQN